jgi:hypothetical protein
MKVRLTEAQYKALEKFIEEARAAEAPVSLKNLFNDNPEAKYFTVVQRLKGGSDDEYSFQFVEQDGHKGIKDVNKMGKTKGCEIDLKPDTMIYGNTFSVSFGSCGTRTINNVIAVKVYADENSLKSGQEMDSMEVEHEMDETPEGLANKYYEMLKNISIDQEIYIDSKNKWDGIVIAKRNDSVEIKIYKHGIPINEADDDSEMEWNVTPPKEQQQQQQKAKPTRKGIVLTLDMKTNPFYVENGKLMLKGVSYDSTTEKKSEFVVPVKKFSTNAGDLKIPRPDKSEKQNQEVEPEVDNPEDVASEEELRKEALRAYRMILKDKNLKDAFYRKPSFWNLFVSELKGKKAPGKGILPTLQLLNSYQTEKLNRDLGAEFIQGKRIQFQPYNKPYTINVGGTSFQLNTDTMYEGTVKKYRTGEDYYVIDSKQGNNGFKLHVKSKTDAEDVFKCELIRYVRDSENKLNTYKHNGDVYIKFNTQSDGYKPVPKSQQKPN